MRIREIEKPKHFVFLYELREVNNRESSLKWFFNMASKGIFNNFLINLEDFRSYHDGSESVCFTELQKTESLILEYQNSSIVNASITGVFENKPISLGISLDNGLISLSFRKANPPDYKKVEQLLGLV